MSDDNTGTTETLRMCVTCGRMHSLAARRCATCRQSFVANGSRTRRIARAGDPGGGVPLFEVSRRPIPRSPGTSVSRRVAPRSGAPRVVVATQG